MGQISFCDRMLLFSQPKGTTFVTGSVLQKAAGAPARTCVLPAVTTAAVGVVLTPATSWRGRGGIRVLMPFKSTTMPGLKNFFLLDDQKQFKVS